MIYNWLNEDNKDILIEMIKSRLNSNQRFEYSGEIETNKMKYISFAINDAHLGGFGGGSVKQWVRIVITNDGQIHYPTDLSEKLSGLQQQVEQYILQESRDKKLKKIINELPNELPNRNRK
jgi:hypothetical protein